MRFGLRNCNRNWFLRILYFLEIWSNFRDTAKTLFPTLSVIAQVVMCCFIQNSREFRRRLWLVIAFSAPLIFSNCKSTGGGSYRDVKYDSSTLKTPTGHGLEKKEYPFDDDGQYRKEWVKANSSGRTKTSYAGSRALRNRPGLLLLRQGPHLRPILPTQSYLLPVEKRLRQIRKLNRLHHRGRNITK